MSTKIGPNSKITVTGAGGYVGSAVVYELLKKGFKVNGTTRTFSKLEPLKENFDKEFGAGSVEIFEIKDLSVPGSLDSALKGCDGLIHVASDVSFSDELDPVVNQVTSMIREVLASANKSDIKAAVVTSSRVAAAAPTANPLPLTLDQGYFEEAYEYAKGTEGPGKGFMTYCASKAAGEKAIWQFVKTQKPKFRVNTILPDMCFGKINNPAPGNYSTGSFLEPFAKGEASMLDGILSGGFSYYNDVNDVAKLHVIALIDDTINHQRIWAATAPLSASELDDVLKEIKPELKERDISKFPPPTKVVIDNKVGESLLKQHYGSGFQDLKTAVKLNLVG